jgi:hypothetical protein
MKPAAYILMLIGVLVGVFAVYNIYVANGGIFNAYLAVGGAVLAVAGMVLKTVADRSTSKKES